MKVFLSGIAGTGMSALAGLFAQKGYQVLGSDNHVYPPVDKILENMKARVCTPYNEKNIPPDIDFCVIGNVISRGNPEAEFILDRGIEYYSMAEALYKFFMKGKKPIVVCGTHGKTTITSFIAHLLQEAGLSPGFFVGGKPKNFDSNYALGEGDYFVVEGDEYETSFFDRSSKFLKYHAHYLVLSALEYDHVDFFPSEELYLKSFTNLVNQVPSSGLIIGNNDFEMSRRAVEKAFTSVLSYGSGDSDFQVSDVKWQGDHYRFSLKNQERTLSFKTPLSGRYNLGNLASGVILGIRLGIDEAVLQHAVESFAGVERRLNKIAEIGETLFLEDFAHHPTSIENVLLSLREAYPGRKLITLFEPRSWSLRRNIFQDRLVKSLSHSDRVVIKDVFEKDKIPGDRRLDVKALGENLQRRGIETAVADCIEEFQEYILSLDFSKPSLVLLVSNGSFDNLPAFVKGLEKKI